MKSWCRTRFGSARRPPREALSAALAALDEHRLLCAHRDGPCGVRHWNRQAAALADRGDRRADLVGLVRRASVLVTANDYGLGLYNGDTGVTVLDGGALRAAIAGAGGVLDFATSRLADVETMHAMTIHKSQGSQADEVTVLLPPEDSRLLSRELFYTAVTRAKTKVRVVGTEAECERRWPAGWCGPPDCVSACVAELNPGADAEMAWRTR